MHAMTQSTVRLLCRCIKVCDVCFENFSDFAMEVCLVLTGIFEGSSVGFSRASRIVQAAVVCANS